MKSVTISRSAVLLLGLAGLIPVPVEAHEGVPAAFLGVDLNGNRLSDIFERLYPAVLDAHADNDKDGQTNEQEMAAGTDPGNPASLLSFTEVNNTGVAVNAAWSSVAGKVYQMQMSPDLTSAWTNEGTAVPGTGGGLNGSCPSSGSRAFLRLEVRDTDTDADGLTDWEELQTGTDRFLWDTDGDGRSDLELAKGLLQGTETVNIFAVESWATEFGKGARFEIVRRAGFRPLTIPFTIGGSATQGTDYNLSHSTQVVLPAGATRASITVTALSDGILEDAETVILTLAPGSGYTLGGNNAATVTIVSQGLIGNYYNTSSGTHTFDPVVGANWDPAQLGLSRRDAVVSFDWSKPTGTPPGTGNGVPGAGIVDDDSWGARWSGFIIPKYTEAYQIIASGDRGFRVFCSINPITSLTASRLNTWTGTTTSTTPYANNLLSSGEVTDRVLQAGRPYYIQVDYRDSNTLTNNAGIDVRWSSASQPEQTIPVESLTSEGFIGTVPVISSNLVALGLTGAPFLYQIVASNTPVSYSAEGLPSGLSVNTSSGAITGTISAAPGVYFASIMAANGGGVDVETLTIVVIGTAGQISRDVWTGVAASGVTAVPVWETPDTSTMLSSMQAPSNAGESFADRMRGFITPPVSGLYTFYASSDENVELWLSSNEEPAHKLKRSWVINGSVPEGEWNNQPTQKSFNVRLTAGEKYYVEAIRLESTGADHFTIGWQKPGDSTPEVIPGYALSPYTNTIEASGDGTLYIANMKPQAGAVSLGSGTALLRVNQAKTQAVLSFTYSNLTGPIISEHIHDDRAVPGPVGAIIFDIDEAIPDANGERAWTFAATGNYQLQDIIDSVEGGTSYINLHTNAYPSGEIKGYFQPVIGSQSFTPPPAAPAAELALPSDPVQRKNAIVRFLQQATFGARHDADGVAPWDPDSIEAVEALGYAGWIDAQFARDKGPDPEVLITQSLPPRIQYREPTAALPTLIPSGTSTGYNGSGPMASFVMGYYDKFPLSSVGNVGAPLESSEEIWRAWWRTAVKTPDQLRQRVAFALSQILVVSEDGELDQLARGMVHYHDLLYWNGTANFRTLLERTTLNPSMGRYLDMKGNRKPNPAIGYIPNENFAREILQLFSIGLRRLHPDGTIVLNSAGLPAATYEQPNVVGYAHTFTGWDTSNGNNYITAMSASAGNHDFTEKLLLEATVIPASSTATTVQCDAELDIALDVIFHHPNVGPFIARQLIQRMVTANPSPGYIYRVSRVFDDNGSGVRGDMAAVVKALLLDSEARNASPRLQPGFGHVKEPVVRATQLMRAFDGFSYGEENYGGANVAGMVSVSPNSNVDLTQPLPLTLYTRVGNRALYPGELVAISGQTPAADNGTYIFNGNGLALTRTTGGTTVATYNTDLADIATSPIPTTTYPGVEGIAITSGTRILLRNQTNAAENGIYVYSDRLLPLVRWDRADEAGELNGAVVAVAAYRDPVTLVYSNKTFQQTAVVVTVGTDPVVFGDGSTTTSGKRAWELGSTGGGSLAQTPLRSATVFNFYEPDFVFQGDTGINGLYSPEFQITSETSVVNTANWFNELTKRVEALPASPLTNGQGYSYGGTILRDVKLNLADSMPFAHDGGALVDHIGGLLMPGQVPARLRTLVSNYLSTLPESMISSNSSWKYFTDATGLGGSDIVVGHASYTSSNWKHPDFVDTSWTDGNAVLGYSTGNAGITSVLPFGPDATLKWRAAYFRKEFQVTDAANVAGLTLRLKRDDGAVVYINGKEARRDNFNAGVVVTGTTLATGAGDNGAAFFDYAIPPSLLVEGRNVIAVEVHQNSNTSSDLFFDVEVKASRNGTPAFNLATPDRVQRLTEALYLLSLSPEFALQN